MRKGLATQTIVLIIVAAIVLGILATLIYTGFNPFRYLSCQGVLSSWCLLSDEDDTAWTDFAGDCPTVLELPGDTEATAACPI